ncbi:MAG TPA: hypothetical protein VFW15_01365 [Thermoanaerobaculia bacterium]|nr:hypothetical protein [Thermoanaerobaculia bacterium]
MSYGKEGARGAGIDDAREDRRRWRMEAGTSLILALATTASAWCAYESTRWGGAQTFRLVAATRAAKQASQLSARAIQLEAFDASMFAEWIKVRGRGEKELEKFFYDRFRPDMQKALDAWLRTNPFEDPSSPRGPFRMAEYVLPETAEADRLEKESTRLLDTAIEANRIADRYVLLTVMFSSVLFFGGMGQTVRSRRLQIISLVIAVVLFAGTMIALGAMPLCRE